MKPRKTPSKLPIKPPVQAAFDWRITRRTAFVRGSDVGYNLADLLHPPTRSPATHDVVRTASIAVSKTRDSWKHVQPCLNTSITDHRYVRNIGFLRNIVSSLRPPRCRCACSACCCSRGMKWEGKPLTITKSEADCQANPTLKFTRARVI